MKLTVSTFSIPVLLILFCGLTFFNEVANGSPTPHHISYPDCPDCGICQSKARFICGTDGQTYHNPCHLGCEKQCRNSGLRVAHEGRCQSPNNV